MLNGILLRDTINISSGVRDSILNRSAAEIRYYRSKDLPNVHDLSTRHVHWPAYPDFCTCDAIPNPITL